MKDLFPIAKLRQLVSVALASEKYQPAESARVRAIPDVRTIRYYTTIGLIDRPAEMKGRTAFYSMKHVRQLVAIKRLQSDGLSLAEIQQKLCELSPQKLASIAALPKGLDSLIDQSDQPNPAASSKAKPAASKPNTSVRQTSEAESEGKELEFWQKVPESNRSSSQSASVNSVLKIRLNQKVTLEVQTDQRAVDVDVELLRAAANELLDELAL